MVSRGPLRPPRPVLPLEPIRRVDHELVRLLRALDPEDWARPASTSWTVRDVAAHLLDGNLRRLSLDRDCFTPELEPPKSGGFGGLLDYLNRLNAEWIRAAKRLSPRLIVELLEVTNPWVLEHFRSLDPEARAAFAVAWAGQERSPAWLDVAREYTEKWHHQHQIRGAVGAPELDDPALLEPLLGTLVWALPPVYEDVEVGEGTVVLLRAIGPLRLGWALRRDEDGWSLHELEEKLDVPTEFVAAAELRLDARRLWRLLMRAETLRAREHAEVQGPPALTDPLFRAVGLMV